MSLARKRPWLSLEDLPILQTLFSLNLGFFCSINLSTNYNLITKQTLQPCINRGDKESGERQGDNKGEWARGECQQQRESRGSMKALKVISIITNQKSLSIITNSHQNHHQLTNKGLSQDKEEETTISSTGTLVSEQHLHQQLRDCRTHVGSLQQAPHKLNPFESSRQLTQLVIQLTERLEVPQNLCRRLPTHSRNSFDREPEDMLDCELTRLPVQGGHLLNRPQARKSLLNHQLSFDLLGEKVQEFQGICDVVGLGHLELVLDSGIEQGSLHFPSILGEPPSQMSFKQVKDIAKATVFESELLLFVPAIHNGADKIISFLPLDHIVQNLIVIGPHEIPNGKVAGPYSHPVLLGHLLLKKRLVLLVLDLSGVYQQLELDFIFIVNLSFRQFGDYWGHWFASFAVGGHEGTQHRLDLH